MKVVLQNLHHVYGKGDAARKLLDNVNVTFEEGDFVAITGPSGVGKSTLLNLIGCLELPTYGSILLEKRDVARCNEKFREQIRLLHIGFLFQSSHLLPALTVEENVLLPMQLAGVARAERHQRCRGLLQAVGMESMAKQSARILSGGQQQKVGLARALANLPGLLLADEPTGSLDERSSEQVLKILQQINASQKVTIILVTHDERAAQTAKRRLYLHEGKLDNMSPRP